MYIFNMEDIWELGGSYRATKILKKKGGLVYTEGLLKVGRGFDREISAKAVFDSNGNGGILNIEQHEDYREACAYFDSHASENAVIIQNMQQRMYNRIRGLILGGYVFLFTVFLVTALICQFTFIGVGLVPVFLSAVMKFLGVTVLILSAIFIIREGMKLFSFNQYYM